MNIKNTFAVIALMTIVATTTCVAQQLRIPFGNRQTSPHDASLRLTQKDGPWLLMCASFVGPDAQAQARNLALELRNTYRLKAYTFSHTFDYSKPYKGKGWEVYKDANGKEQLREGKTMKTASDASFTEVAVLVGDFPNVEDARAQQTLAQVKKISPKSISEVNFNQAASDENVHDGGHSQKLRFWREVLAKSSRNPEKASTGPMRAAFLLPNPMLPDEYFEANRVDHFMLKFNQKREINYSLLKNKSPYSVRVATFRGDSTFDLHEVQKNRFNSTSGKRGDDPAASKLMIAFAKAHRLTEELRRLNVEAYEFHDRNESYVCVGGFDWISTKDEFGNPKFNEDVTKVIDTFKANIRNDLPNMPGAVAPKVLPKLKKLGIAFDSQPVPVVVPRAQTRTASGLFSGWK